jgi:hypothetical protein
MNTASQKSSTMSSAFDQLAVAWLTMFIIGSDLFVVSPLLPLIACRLYRRLGLGGIERHRICRHLCAERSSSWSHRRSGRAQAGADLLPVRLWGSQSAYGTLSELYLAARYEICCRCRRCRSVALDLCSRRK